MGENSNSVDKFHLFYTEAIMNDSAFPEISKIRPIFENITLQEFIELVNRVFESEDYETTQQFFYFLVLFRDMEHLQTYINSDEFGVKNLEKFIIFTYGYCTIHDLSTERIIDEILYFLSNEKLLGLVLESDYIYNDKLLLFFILSKFDVELLNRYFAKIRGIDDFVNSFIRLPEEVLRSIISRNYHLFQYVMLMMAEGTSTETVSESFYSKFKDDIDQFSRLSDLLKKYRDKDSGFEKEKLLPFNKRDMERISFLVNMVKDLPDPARGVDYFAGEKVFADDMEKGIVLAIVTDPLLKNVFSKYDSMFEI